MKTKEKLLKKLIYHYCLNEDDDIYIQQIQHRIEQLQKHKEQVDSHIENLKITLEHLKEKKQKITDEISRLRLKKQTVKLQDKGII